MKKLNLGVLATGLIMLVSTVGFAWTGSFTGSTTTTTVLGVPENHVIDYELSSDQKTFLIGKGVTVVEYLYDPQQNNTNSSEIKSILESLAYQFNDQVVLSEIKVSSADYIDLPRVSMDSAVGIWTPKNNITSQSVLDAFCAVSVYPPIGCALSKLPQGNATNTSA